MSDIERVNRYVHTQQALGNWPPDHVWPGDDAILALADTYNFIAG